MLKRNLTFLGFILCAIIVCLVTSCSKDDEDKDVSHHYVDLGLPSGTKWAIANIGATKPEESGYYYMWGDLSFVTSGVSWSKYKHSNGSKNSLKKYNTKSEYGTPDNITILESSDDVASVELGGEWRMPTMEEYKELVDKCVWKWTTLNGVVGKTATGPNGKSIFFPAVGTYNDDGMLLYKSYGSLWSSSLVSEDPTQAYYFEFRENSQGISGFERIFGRNVRAVFHGK